MWFLTLAIIAVAMLGKFLGASVTSYMLGMKWKDSAGLGVLMNTRGLVELVVLTVGLDLGILSPVLFTMMVAMALVTTFMATPMLVAMKIAPARRRQSHLSGHLDEECALGGPGAEWRSHAEEPQTLRRTEVTNQEIPAN